MRGSHSLFTEIFPTQIPEKQRKGRSETFDTQRNECLISAYYYIGLNSGYRYDLLIKIISRQFWLSETTVRNIMQLNHHLLLKVRKEQPTKTDLKKKWPHIAWEIPDLKDYI